MYIYIMCVRARVCTSIAQCNIFEKNLMKMSKVKIYAYLPLFLHFLLSLKFSIVDINLKVIE